MASSTSPGLVIREQDQLLQAWVSFGSAAVTPDLPLVFNTPERSALLSSTNGQHWHFSVPVNLLGDLKNCPVPESLFPAMIEELYLWVSRMAGSMWLPLFVALGLGQAEPDFPPPSDRPKIVIPPVNPTPHAESLSLFGSALLKARRDQHATAVKLLEQTVKSEPDAVAPQRELVALYQQLGRDAAAIRVARQVLKLDPHDADTANRLGTILFEARQFSLAAEAFAQASRSPQRASQPAQRLTSWLDACRAYLAAGQGKSAEQAAQECLTILRTEKAILTRPGGFTAEEIEQRRAELYVLIAEAETLNKRFVSAEAALATSRVIAENSGKKALAYRVDWQLMTVAMNSGDWDKARKHLEQYLQNRPANLEPYRKWVELQRKLEQPTIEGLKQFARDNPRNKNLAWLLAAEELVLDPDTVHARFLKLTAEPILEDQLILVVEAYSRAGLVRPFLEILQQQTSKLDPEMNDTNPGAKPIPTNLAPLRGMTKYLRQDAPFSRKIVQQIAEDLLQEKQYDTSLLKIILEIATSHGLQSQLIDGLQKVTRVKSDRPLYLMFLRLLAQERRWRDLATFARMARSREDFQNQLAPYYSEALAYAELNDAQKSLEAIDFVIKNVVADGRLPALLERARLYNILGQPKKAIAECEEILSEFKTPAAHRQARLILADSWNLLKDHVQAEKLLRELLDHDPDDYLVLNNLGYNLADQGRKLEEAEMLIRRAVELDQFDRKASTTVELSSGIYLDSLGWVLFRRGQYAESLKVFEQAARLPDSAADPVVWDHLGDVRYRIGDRIGAKDAWQKAEKLYRNSHVGRQNGRHAECQRKLKLLD